MKTFAGLLLTPLVWATCTTGASGFCEVGTSKTYATIAACLAAPPAAGQTCQVYAGSYTESPTIPAGTAGNYITVQNNPGDTVTVTGGFTLNSHTKLIGLSVTTTSTCVSIAANATDVYITNNNLSYCTFISEARNSNQNTTFVYIQGNTMAHSGGTPASPNPGTAIFLQGDHQLVENNDISHVSDGPYMNGKWVVMRGNTFHDSPTSESGSNSGNCHIDMFQVDATVPGNLPTRYYLVEKNKLFRFLSDGATAPNCSGPAGHGFGLIQGESCAGNCSNLIARFQLSAHVGQGAVLDDNSGNISVNPGWYNVKSYNNTWADVNQADYTTNGSGTNGYTHNSVGGSDVNSIFYYPGTSTMPDFNPYLWDSSSITPTGSAPAGFPFGTASWGHSIAFSGGTSTLRSHVYGVGSWTGDTGNLKTDPLFSNYAGDDYTLQSGSPARSAGASLTTTVGTGASSTALVVADANFFQDGWGLTGVGVQADTIRIGGSTVVQISSIDYSTNTITLAAPASWSNGVGVYLYKDSSGVQVLTAISGTACDGGPCPDAGAFPFVPSGSAPTVTTTTASGIGSTTATAGGNVTSDGGVTVTARGTCYALTANPTSPCTSDGTGTGIFTSSLSGLTPGTLYHYRAFATNSIGTSYGADLTFTALTVPTLTTTVATSITTATATSGGAVTSNGGASVSIEGVCYATTANPTTPCTTNGTATPFTSPISGLSPATLYHYRAYATNAAGTGYGNELTFTTVNGPAVTTTTLPAATTTQAAYSASLTVTGGTAPITCSGVFAPSGSGLVVNSNCTVSGTAGVAGNYSANITPTDSNGISGGAQPVTITINAVPSITTTSPLPNAFQGIPYSTTLTTSGGTAPISCSITLGTLPTGLLLTGSTCTISGTPTSSAVSSVAIAPTDVNNISGSPVNFSLTVIASANTVGTVSVSGGLAGNK